MQHKLPVRILEKTYELSNVCMHSENNMIFVTEGKNKYTFDAHRGRLCTIGDVMTKPTVLDVWRAPTDNERRIRYEWGIIFNPQAVVSNQYNCMQTKIYSCEFENNVITTKGVLSAMSMRPIFPFVTTYTFLKDGVKVHLSGELSEAVTYLPRLGFTFRLPKEMSKFSYFGGGPHACYIDMYRHTKVGLFESTAENEYEPYPVPQEHGNHNRARLLQFDGIRFESDADFEFNVSRYSADMLTEAKHTNELIPEENILVRIDYKSSGIGSASCGAPLQEKYIMKAQKVDFTFFIFNENKGNEVGEKE